MTTRRLTLIGPPGAGKGTYAERLSADFNLPHIATGDMLRHEVEEATELGSRAKSFMDRGELVPDELVVELTVNRLRQSDATDGWILDGFPRSVAQARGLDQELGAEAVESVIALDVPTEEIIDRISGRRVCPRGHVYHVTRDPPQRPGICNVDGGSLSQREDDKEEVVRHRIEIYGQETQPLFEFYDDKGILQRIDGRGSPDVVYREVVAVLGC
jgi:adenylate kinase